jgi:PKD repeat protein
VNEISVIFHVVHDAADALGTGTNVSNADIMAVYNDLVGDFLGTNPDIGNARPPFTPANANINFCLATQDPNGTPLTEVGVIRAPTNEDWYDSDNGEENKMKSAANGGSEIWDRNNYLNVWICDISNGANSGTAGYAYRPSMTFLPSASIDGIVLDYNIGLTDDVLTHEVGHYLGLDHTWGGSGGCGNDDGFNDTPITAGPSFDYPGSCSGSQQTCAGTETQYENYMDYANCTVMFTQDQADYMLAILQGIRSSLLLSPGCDPVDAPPVVDFVADQTVIPVGATVNFTSMTTNVPDSWTWDFGGGATNVTTENASATFNTVGFYTITHTATNAFGTGNEVKTNYIEVVATATGIACDTLRNYNPLNDFYYVTWVDPLDDGYMCGNSTWDGVGNVPEWAEFYQASSATTVKALEFVPHVISDGGGNVTFNVYENNAGAPGTIVASETVPLADLTASAWNNIAFTTPQATPLVQFWVGYEVSYNSIDTFALLVDVAPPSGVNEVWVDYPTIGWLDPFTGTNAGIIDVLTSNGPNPTANATYSATEIW